jgi:hypothetical protein
MVEKGNCTTFVKVSNVKMKKKNLSSGVGTAVKSQTHKHDDIQHLLILRCKECLKI